MTTTARLNIRTGMPTTSAPVVRRVEVGTVLGIGGVATGETVNGNAQWYAGDSNTFFWSGACSDFQPGQPTAPPAGIGVHRRPTGTDSAVV